MSRRSEHQKSRITRLKTGDTVQVIAGIDRGKKGKITQMLRSEGMVVVEGVNTRKKNVRARRERQKGEIIEFFAPFAISNCMLVCPRCVKPTRIGIQRVKDARNRICQRCHQHIDT
jgi:large subunit ribosomal protein L24